MANKIRKNPIPLSVKTLMAGLGLARDTIAGRPSQPLGKDHEQRE